MGDSRKKVKEIDLRDGVEDNKVTRAAMDCPNCSAKINNQYNRCFFCDYRVESDDAFRGL